MNLASLLRKVQGNAPEPTRRPAIIRPVINTDGSANSAGPLESELVLTRPQDVLRQQSDLHGDVFDMDAEVQRPVFTAASRMAAPEHVGAQSQRAQQRSVVAVSNESFLGDLPTGGAPVLSRRTNEKTILAGGIVALPFDVSRVEKVPDEKALVSVGISLTHARYLKEQRGVLPNETLADLVLDVGLGDVEQAAMATSLIHGMPFFSESEETMLSPPDMKALVQLGFEPDPTVPFLPVGWVVDQNRRESILVLIDSPERANLASSVIGKLNGGSHVALAIASRPLIQKIYRRYFSRSLEAWKASAAVLENACANADSATADQEKLASAIENFFGNMLRHICVIGASDLHLLPTGKRGIFRIMVDGAGVYSLTLTRATFDRVYRKLITMFGNEDDLIKGPVDSQIKLTDLEAGKLSDTFYTRFADIAQRYSFRLVFIRRSDNNRTLCIRVLDGQSAISNLSSLGFSLPTLKSIGKLSGRGQGLILITGPTGSGKTNTNYAWLKSIDAVARPIQTIEKPIEASFPAMMQYDPPINLSENDGFKAIIKGLLRNAPKVCLIGEMRDRDITDRALEMSMTGHLVFGTMHTNSVVGTIQRMMHMGLEPVTFMPALVGILSQRLARLLCPMCKVEDVSTDTLEMYQPYAQALGTPAFTPFKPRELGCAHCGGTGYKGRRLVYELLTVKQQLRQDLMAGKSLAESFQDVLPLEETLRGRAMALLAQGLTCAAQVDEVSDE
jgi:type II secretory ATPase GspE/PulE/Tfp pilus assembly ATPase PilB-like protein